MMGVILTVMSQRIRGAGGSAADGPWNAPVIGAAVVDVDLDNNRAAVTIKEPGGGQRVEIYDVRTGELIGIVTVVGP